MQSLCFVSNLLSSTRVYSTLSLWILYSILVLRKGVNALKEEYRVFKYEYLYFRIWPLHNSIVCGQTSRICVQYYGYKLKIIPLLVGQPFCFHYPQRQTDVCATLKISGRVKGLLYTRKLTKHKLSWIIN